MKRMKCLTIFVALAVIVSSCAIMKKKGNDGTVTISGILKDAKCPLTKEQETRLKEFRPGGDRGAFRALNEMFDEKQTAALKKVFGSSPGRGGRPARPRYLFFAVMFENENIPFTREQLEKLQALPEGREGFQQMRNILTEKQNALVQSMFNR